MCSLCGSLGRGPVWEHEDRAGQAEARWRLHRDAMEAAASLTRHLSPCRVRVRANADFGFLVEFPTGGVVVTTGIMGVWHALDAVRIPIPDPLDA